MLSNLVSVRCHVVESLFLFPSVDLCFNFESFLIFCPLFLEQICQVDCLHRTPFSRHINNVIELNLVCDFLILLPLFQAFDHSFIVIICPHNFRQKRCSFCFPWVENPNKSNGRKFTTSMSRYQDGHAMFIFPILSGFPRILLYGSCEPYQVEYVYFTLEPLDPKL